MLIEECGLNNINVISANTDSITIYDNKDKLSIFNNIKENWEKITLHTLENTEYKQIVYRDVNNYIAETTEGKPKYKGVFDTFEDKNSDKFDGWHKNQSMMIVAIALKNYYIDNIPIEETINNHKDIFDFCKAVKGIKDSQFEFRVQTNKKPYIISTPLQRRVNRYIVTTTGGKLIKILPSLKDEDGNIKSDKLARYKQNNPTQLNLFDFVEDVIVDKDREFEVESQKNVIIMNKIESENIEDYDIDYKYYIKECYKIINQIK